MKELKKGETGLEHFVDRAKKLAEGLAAAFAVKEVYEFVEGQVKAMTQVERTAAALGVSTEKVQELQYASKALGMDGDALLNMLGKLEVNQFKAAGGSKEAANAFSLLGVHVKDAHGKLKPVDELLPDIAEGIKKTADPAKAAAIATALFGKQGRELLPFLKEGREGVEKYAKEFSDLGGGFTKESIEAAKEFEHQQAKMSVTLKSLSSTIMQALLPMVGAMVGWVQRGVMAFKQLAEGSEIVRAAMIVLGGVATVFAIQMAAANAPILLAAAAIAFLVLLVDDLINLFEGNNSLIGEQIDKIFGKGTKTDVIDGLKAAWHGVADAIERSVKFMREHKETLDKIMETIQKYPAIVATKAVERKVVELSGEIGDKLGRNEIQGQEDQYRLSGEQRQRLAGTFSGPGANSVNIAPGEPGSAYFGPRAPTGGPVTVKEGDIHFHVAGDLSNEVHERAAQQWHEHRKRERRETAATLQRAPAVAGGR